MNRRTANREALSEETVVRAAMAIIRRKGAAALTMRELADALGVTPMATYHHVRGKEDLLRLVGNHVWGSVALPPADAGPWYERLRALVTAERDAIKRYRGLYEALLYVDVEQKVVLEDAQLDLLLDAGWSPARAVPAFRALRSWLGGNAFMESALRDPSRRRAPAGWSKAQRLTYDRTVMPEMNADDYFAAGLDVIIAGLRAQEGVTR